MIEQENLSKGIFLSTIKEIMKEGCLTERAMELQKEVALLDGLETAIKTTLEVAEGGNRLVSA